jgi:hypothetical protein
VSWAGGADLAIALAEVADRPVEWPALGRVDLGPIRLVLVPNDDEFSRLARGRVPDWGVGLAFPQSGTIVLRADDNAVRQTLRHEMAHLALHRMVEGRVPLWFDEGYAGWAAGEFDRLDGWGLNLAVIRRRVPSFGELNSALRGSSFTAGTAYALAITAVLELARRNPTSTLEPLFDRLRAGYGFEAAVIATTGYTPDGFELVWQKSVRRRYSLLTWLAAGGMWLILAGIVVVAHWHRRRRDRPRRAALDHGWDVGEWRPSAAASGGEGTAVPPEGQSAADE